MLRKLGWLCVAAGVVAIIAELIGLQLPTLRWPFTTSRELNFLNFTSQYEQDGNVKDHVFPWFGYVFCVLFSGLGGLLLYSNPKGAPISPITQRRIQRFKEIRRGYISLWIVLILALVAGLDQLVVGNKALFVEYNGKWYFPAFQKENYRGSDFGQSGEAGPAPADYRVLQENFADSENLVIMPIIPYAPAEDTVRTPVEKLEEKDGLIYQLGSNKPFDGLATTLYDTKRPSKIHMRYRFRKGLKDGMAEGKDLDGNLVWKMNYEEGKLVNDEWLTDGDKEAFLKAAPEQLYEVLYSPSRPSSGHYLGTNSSAYDLVAYLYGGLQVNFKAALFYIPAVYVIGISVGLLMGFFGGAFDLIVQRLIEIFSNIPFLFIVIIISSSVPENIKGLGIILLILVLFGWMGMTYLMRTAAYKEKARDYVAASKVLGASTPRIIFKHILPNTIAILVTLVPFSVSSLIMSLTALDYLGFGLPPNYATWGSLLRDGLENLSYPGLVLSSFTSLVLLLVLITFIGEAVREAFDPKKYTYYE